MTTETTKSVSRPVGGSLRSGVANALFSGVIVLAGAPLACAVSSDPLEHASAASAVAGGGAQGVPVAGSGGAAAGGAIGAASVAAGAAAAGAAAAGAAGGGGLALPAGGTAGAMSQGNTGVSGASGASNTSPTCTNMTNLLFFIPGATMRPGEACLSCHDGGKAPKFQIAGTLFPMAHDQDDCNGVNGTTAGDKVMITDAAGKVATLDVNLAGNFYYQGSLTPPYQAKVVRGAAEHMMLTKQMSGDCNGCHTVRGANGAPGRILAP